MNYQDYNIFFDSNSHTDGSTLNSGGSLYLNTTIKTENEDFALIGLQNYTFYNTFPNVQSPNNVITIGNLFINNVTQQKYTLTSQFTVPTGTYSLNSLISFFNANCTINQDEAYNVTVNGPQGPANYTTNSAVGTPGTQAYLFLGFGYTGNNGSTSTPINAIQINPYDSSKLLVFGADQYNNQKTYLTGQGPATDPYYYLAAFFIFNDASIPILNLMGFYTNIETTQIVYTDYVGIGLSISDPTNLSLQAPNVYNMNLVNFLYFCSSSLSSSKTRASNKVIDDNSVIAIIPVNSEFGYQCNYEAHPPIFSEINISSLKQIEFTIFDNNKNLVNFQGTPWAGCLTLRLFPEILNKSSQRTDTTGREKLFGPNSSGPPSFNFPNRNHLLQDPRSKKRQHPS